MGAIFTLSSHCKINLTLKLLGKDPVNSYHFVSTVMAKIDLSDTIEIEDSDSYQLELQSPFGGIPHDTNLITKSVELIKDQYDYDCKCKVKLTKNIPIASGLGGGSSNAAVFMKFYLDKLEIPEAEQIKFAKQTGVDTCFFIRNDESPVNCIHYGEIMNPISFEIPKGLHIALVNPMVQVSTIEVYKNSGVQAKEESAIDFSAPKTFMDAMKMPNNLTPIARKLSSGVGNLLDEIGNIVKSLSSCLKYDMSGSGATCFGIFEDKKDAEKMIEKLKEKFPNYLTILTTFKNETKKKKQ